MGKALITAKWVVNIVLVIMVLATAASVVQTVGKGMKGETTVVALPVSALPRMSDEVARSVTEASERTGQPDDGLRGADGSIEHDELGVGQLIPIETHAYFTVSPFSRAGLLGSLGLAFAIVPAFLLVIILRQIILSAAAGTPFIDANVTRLRAIGAIVIAAEGLRGAIVLAIQAYLRNSATSPSHVLVVDGSWNVTFVILGVVVLALAEVFRHGLALQSDADLTV